MKPNRAILVVIILSSLLSSGCARGVKINKLYDIDATEKSITVPPGSSLLIGPFKKVLAANGWKMSVYRGPEVTDITKEKNIKMSKYDTFNTRYQLLINQISYGWNCWTVGDELSMTLVGFDIVIIDTKTGEESLTMSGKSCANEVVDAFENYIKNK